MNKNRRIEMVTYRKYSFKLKNQAIELILVSYYKKLL